MPLIPNGDASMRMTTGCVGFLAASVKCLDSRSPDPRSASNHCMECATVRTHISFEGR